MKVSKTGLTLAAIYLGITLLCVGYGLLGAGGDDKGAFVLIQLPIALQAAAVIEFPLLDRLMMHMGWVEAYAILWPPAAMLLYLAGWIVGSTLSGLGGRVSRHNAQ